MRSNINTFNGHEISVFHQITLWMEERMTLFRQLLNSQGERFER